MWSFVKSQFLVAGYSDGIGRCAFTGHALSVWLTLHWNLHEFSSPFSRILSLWGVLMALI